MTHRAADPCPHPPCARCGDPWIVHQPEPYEREPSWHNRRQRSTCSGYRHPADAAPPSAEAPADGFALGVAWLVREMRRLIYGLDHDLGSCQAAQGLRQDIVALQLRAHVHDAGGRPTPQLVEDIERYRDDKICPHCGEGNRA